jgi:hypothetical protein
VEAASVEQALVGAQVWEQHPSEAASAVVVQASAAAAWVEAASVEQALVGAQVWEQHPSEAASVVVAQASAQLPLAQAAEPLLGAADSVVAVFAMVVFVKAAFVMDSVATAILGAHSLSG